MALTTVRPQGMGFNTGGRNLIKNGAMLVSQRGTSFTSSSTAYTLDRFQVLENFGAAFTITQSNTVPDEVQFTKSLKMDCTTAATPSGTSEEFKLVYRMEGYDFLPSGYGNSYAKNLTLSFWVRSNLTGTYRINFMSRSGTNRNIGATYTISSANTWEKKKITFIPDTSVSPYQDHQDAFRIEWYLASSSDRTTGSVPTSWATMDNATRATGLNVNMASSTDNEWYITGVQLELGPNASDFEHRSYGEELGLCQRYFVRWGGTSAYERICHGQCIANNRALYHLVFPQTMRAVGTLGRNGCAGGTSTAGAQTFSSLTVDTNTDALHSTTLDGTVSGTPFTAGNVSELFANNSTAHYIEIDAEL